MHPVSNVKAQTPSMMDAEGNFVVSLTLDKAAKACGYSSKTLRGAIENGSLIGHRASDAPNSKIIVLVPDLIQWVEALPFATKKTA